MEYLTNIVWPIYAIKPHRELWIDNNVMHITTNFEEDLIVDNKNIVGGSLGIRRARINEKLYPLSTICYTMYDVFNCKYRLFIDSKGILQKINKTKTYKLQYKKVESTKVLTNKVLCKCTDVFRWIEIPFIPKIMPKYLGLLVINKDYMLYELCSEKKNNTWRKG